jgi:hypothetical protein
MLDKVEIAMPPSGKDKMKHPKYVVCEDTGSAIKGENRLDFYTGSADLVNDGPELFGWCEPHTDCSDPAASADPEGEVGSAACEGHASAGERMAAAEPLRHTRRDAAHLIRDPRMAEVGQAQW